MATETDEPTPSSSFGEVDGESRSKRQKVNSSIKSDTAFTLNAPLKHDELLIGRTRGRMPRGCTTPKESVLHLPPRLTKSAYQTLLTCHAVPRQWHLEGRFGSRTHKVEKSINGIPVLYDQKTMEEKSLASPELKQLLDTEGVSIVEKEYVRNHRTNLVVPDVDARIHPELEPDDFDPPSITPKCMDANRFEEDPAFTYAEMFGGIGGFGVGLESLGGKCVFYSEVDERCRETYELNFDTPPECIHGDIYDVPDDAFPKNLDILVGGFPCQPFTNLGEQPGFDCDKGRGRLYLQIVRALELSRPKSFLFENVPGLLGMPDTLAVIVGAFRGAGYRATGEICSARGLTATGRKRLLLVGVRNDLVSSDISSDAPGDAKCDPPPGGASPSPFDRSFFRFPYVPDLKLCSHDVLDYDSLAASELEILRLSPSTLSQLSRNKKWKPNRLAWPNRHCDTITSHYGNAVGRGESQLVPSSAVGRGESQLVPSSAPGPPRRLSVRECARIMGFPDAFEFRRIRAGQGDMAHRKEGYRMIGNAVCPPLIAATAGAVLDAAGVRTGKGSCDDEDWTSRGRRAAVALSCAALRPGPAFLPAGCLLADRVERG